MRNINKTRAFIGIIVVGILAAVAYFLFLSRGRPAPIPMKDGLYEGVTYRRIVRYFPKALVAHVIVVDTKKKGSQFIVTPAECVKCGFVFEKRGRLTKPGKCPVCRSESIHAPLFAISLKCLSAMLEL